MGSIITLTTDFGSKDHYSGAMKGVILSINPDVTITDITHEIPPHEESVREVAGEMLRHLGYEVEYAGNGIEAIQKYNMLKENGQAFDVVIIDLTIPGGMGGKEAMERLLDIDPRVKAIVSSGYSNDPVMAEYN